jgi:hypothetical protein
MKQADALFSKLIRHRDQRCRRCGTFERLQCAHLITRSYKSIRIDPDNAIALCQGCHVFFTHRPIEWDLFIEEEFPGRLSELRAKALRYERVDWRQAVVDLKAQISEYEWA